MRISDWSSDVCSSDLRDVHRRDHLAAGAGENRLLAHIGAGGKPRRVAPREVEEKADENGQREDGERDQVLLHGVSFMLAHGWWQGAQVPDAELFSPEIGRASCRERVCQYV